MSDDERLAQIRERAAAALRRDPSWELLTDDVPWMDAAINRLLAVNERLTAELAAVTVERDALREALAPVITAYDNQFDGSREWDWWGPMEAAITTARAALAARGGEGQG